MRRIAIGICDDEEYFLESLYTLVSTACNESGYDFSVTKYQESEELIEELMSGKKEYDILFLDIDMPKLSGMDVAVKLRAGGYEGIICFVTSHSRYALEAYGVDALGYLLKPAEYISVKRLLEKAVIQIFYKFNEEEAAKRFLEINTQKGKVLINVENILYVEKRRNQSVIHLEDGEIVCYETLKSVFGRLNQNKFCYTHQGYVVNFDKIKEVLPTFIALGEGREIPVSRKYQKALSERHINLIYQIAEERRKKRLD